ncbi:MAG: DUF2799 domain-containing protein [Parvularculaceae bacterium]
MRKAVLFLFLFALAGCAGMSKKECLTADWRAIGYEDGAAGAPVSAITPRRQACAEKIGAAPDMDAYLTGRNEGLADYCRPANGFAVGARGAAYQGVCKDEIAEPFLAAYRRGSELYARESEAIRAGEAVAGAQDELWNIRARIAELEAALVSPETPNADRVQHLVEMKNLFKDRRRVEADIAALLREEERAEAALFDYRRNLAEETQDGVLRPARASY